MAIGIDLFARDNGSEWGHLRDSKARERLPELDVAVDREFEIDECRQCPFNEGLLRFGLELSRRGCTVRAASADRWAPSSIAIGLESPWRERTAAPLLRRSPSRASLPADRPRAMTGATSIPLSIAALITSSLVSEESPRASLMNGPRSNSSMAMAVASPTLPSANIRFDDRCRIPGGKRARLRKTLIERSEITRVRLGVARLLAIERRDLR